MKEIKKIFVTGVAGFIGSYVCKNLLNKGYSVIGIDNINDYYSPLLKRYRLSKLQINKNFEFHEVDIEHYQTIYDIVKNHKIKAVINLAARAGVRYSLVDPFIYETTNSIGTLNLLEICRYQKIPKFILASTSSLYSGQSLPFKEDLPVNTPISPYAASKKGAEMMAYSYHYLYGIDVSVCRYFTVYGPAGRPDMSYFRFTKQIYNNKPLTIYGDGTQIRDFTFVEDIAEGTVKALKPVGYEVINLGNDNPHELNEMIGLIERNLCKNAKFDFKPFHKADMKATRADISKADKLLGWRPKVKLEEGIEKMVNWFKENPELIDEIKLIN